MARARQAAVSLLLTLLLCGVLIGHTWVERSMATVVPHVPAVDPELFDTRPVAITVTAFWQKLPRVVTVHQLLTDHTIWRRMQFGDWDKVGSPTRERALAGMLGHYRHVLDGPEIWAQLSIYDWDHIPHPIRAFAFQRLIEHWTRYYDVGAGYADNPEIVAQTVSAIVMAESWFEHRAIAVNPWGNRDLGLAGCSNHCRRVLEQIAAEGRLDFVLDDHEYFDPWNGTRVAAVWFGRELVRAQGDMDLAIAAYHRGMNAARRGEGTDYAANVKRLRRRYIQGQASPPAWAYLQRTIAQPGAESLITPGSPVSGTAVRLNRVLR